MGESFWNGAQAAHRRVMMKAAGYSDEDIRKSHISACQILIWLVRREQHI